LPSFYIARNLLSGFLVLFYLVLGMFCGSLGMFFGLFELFA